MALEDMALVEYSEQQWESWATRLHLSARTANSVTNQLQNLSTNTQVAKSTEPQPKVSKMLGRCHTWVSLYLSPLPASSVIPVRQGASPGHCLSDDYTCHAHLDSLSPGDVQYLLTSQQMQGTPALVAQL